MSKDRASEIKKIFGLVGGSEKLLSVAKSSALLEDDVTSSGEETDDISKIKVFNKVVPNVYMKYSLNAFTLNKSSEIMQDLVMALVKVYGSREELPDIFWTHFKFPKKKIEGLNGYLAPVRDTANNRVGFEIFFTTGRFFRKKIDVNRLLAAFELISSKHKIKIIEWKNAARMYQFDIWIAASAKEMSYWDEE